MSGSTGEPMSELTSTGVRVRFAPSPTGNPHVGLARTALFNWAFARHTGGTLVLRIEDTDASRNTEQSYADLLAALRWLGLDWDEGPEVGGAHGPYRQSERSERYAAAAAALRAAGHAYDCFCTADEVSERNRAAGRPPGYDGFCRDLTDADRSRFVADGRAPVSRFRMPGRDTVYTDLVRGELKVAADHVPDYVLVRASGDPLYTLTNPLDDAAMGITHVLRGEDLLSSTPRQIALYEALRDVELAGPTPRFGHLPYVMGEGNKKLSKRDPEGALDTYRRGGFLPEGLMNYLALLGWSIAEDRDVFSLAEMATAFELSTVNANPARFDLRKCEAINAQWIRRLDQAELADRLVPHLVAAGLLADPPTAEQRALLAVATPLVAERMTLLTDAVGMLGFLFVADDAVVRDEAALAKANAAAGVDVTGAAGRALAALGEWSAAGIEQALKTALVDDLGLKPRKAFAPVRIAVTGRTVSPPLYESLELLGRDAALARLAACPV